MATTAETALIAQLTVPASESKKFRMATIGLGVIGLVFLIAAVLFVLDPTAFEPLLDFAKAVAASVAGVVVVFSGAQAAVDHKVIAALATK